MTTAVNTQTQSNSSTNPQRGIASLTWGNHVLRFRTNPNDVSWNYGLITKTDQTYGGRVVQILGTKIEDLTVTVECGNGGWPYLVKVVTFMRDMMIAQRNGQTATFEYTSRNWKLKVYAAGFPFGDQVTATTREIALTFKVQEDISGIVSSQTIAAALQSFMSGIGWSRTQYNDFFAPNNDTGMIPSASTFTGGALNIPGNANLSQLDLSGPAAAAKSAAAVVQIPSVTGGALGSGVLSGLTSALPQFNLFTIPTAY